MPEDCIVYDKNPGANLALIERGGTAQYVPLNEVNDLPIQRCDASLLKQRHYVARAAPAGFFVAVAPMRLGWQRA